MEKYNVKFNSIEQISEFVTLAGKSRCNMNIGEGTVMIDAKSIEGLIVMG